MDIIEYLTKCEYCNNVFNHYDYLAHREICYLGYNGYEADNENDNIGLSYNLNYPSRIKPTSTTKNNIQTSILDDLIVNSITTRMNSMILNNGISKNELYKYCTITHLADPYECPLCLIIHNQTPQTMQPQQQYIKIKCGHLFCNDCGQKWFEYRALCPICKYDIRI
jgi:hypothetical protein